MTSLDTIRRFFAAHRIAPHVRSRCRGSSTESLEARSLLTAIQPQILSLPEASFWLAGENSLDDRAGVNDGAQQGNMQYVSGRVGSAIRFDGTTSVNIRKMDSTFDPRLGDFTIEAWIKPDLSAAPFLTSTVYSNYGGLSLMNLDVNPAGAVDFYCRDREGDFVSASEPSTSFTNVRDGAWHHVAGVRSGVKFQLFIDGSLKAETVAVNVGDIASQNQYVHIGASETGVGYITQETVTEQNWFYKGLIDELSTFPRALSPSEIASIYAAGANGKTPSAVPSIYYSFDSSSNDLNGNNDGVAGPGVAYIPGVVSSAAYFNGSNYVSVLKKDNAFEFVNGDFSIAAWVKPDLDMGGSIESVIYSNYDGTSHCYLSVLADGHLYFNLRDTALQSVSLTSGLSAPNLRDSQWHHVAVTRSGSSFAIYVDGQIAATSTNSSIGNARSVSSSCYIGSSAASGAWFYKGAIDELAIYPRSLTSGEVAQRAALSVQEAVSGPTFWFSGGGTPDDIAGSNNGQVENTVSYEAGVIGQSPRFTGSNAVHILQVDSTLSPGAGDFTVEGWVKPDVFQGPVGLKSIFVNYSGTNEYAIFLNETGRLKFEVRDSALYLLEITDDSAASSSLYDGQWHHISVQREGSSFSIWVDGVRRKNVVNTTVGSINLTNQYASIGGFNTTQTTPVSNQPDKNFRGLIDELRFWPRAIASSIVARDFGDAPDTGSGTGTGNYQTLAANGGPSHDISLTQTTLFLGAGVDGESDAAVNGNANGDDRQQGSLQTGVIQPTTDLIVTVGAVPQVRVRATNTSGASATLYGWMDYNQDGVFDNTTERGSVTIPAGSINGTFTVTFPQVPTNAVTGTSYARFRLSADSAAANSTGAAVGGEVEDYQVSIQQKSDGTVDPSKTVFIGQNTNGGPGLSDNDQYGARAVANIGDLDGDGINDMAVGAYFDDTGSENRGALYIQFMNANGTVRNITKLASGINGAPGLSTGDTFGWSAAAIGDLDGDGVTEIAVGAAADSTLGLWRGAIHVLFMNTNGTVKTSTKIASSQNGGPSLSDVSIFGGSLAAIGDIDGDGIPDLAAGSHVDNTGGQYRGAVYVLLMNANGSVKQSVKVANGTNGGPILNNLDQFGFAVAAIGDLDHDGITELAVGARGIDNYLGGFYTLFLNSNGTVRNYVKVSNNSNGGPTLNYLGAFGSGIASAGDLDGDSVPDLLIGAPTDSLNGTYRGAFYVVTMHADGRMKSSYRIGSSSNGGPALSDGDFFGEDLTLMGDLNGDGVPEIAVAARGTDFGGPNRGAVYVMSLNGAFSTDFGDAPDTNAGTGKGNYQTLAANGGPSHDISLTQTTLFLGAGVDGEWDAAVSLKANGDDRQQGSLQSGVVQPGTDLQWTVGTAPKVRLRATNNTATAATLYGWIDYNQDGVFDNATERTSVSIPAGSLNSVFTLTFSVIPNSAPTGTTYARFRLSSDTAASNSTGPAVDGEVEDYPASILQPTDGTVDGTKTVKIASSTNGGPALSNNDQFGKSVATIGDLDGDGISDLVVGAYRDSDRGAIYVQFMNSNGTVRNSTKIASGLNGGPSVAIGDTIGWSIAPMGDMDGDGVVDIAVGAGADSTGGQWRGAVHIFFLNSNGTVKTTTKIASGVNGGPTLQNSDLFGTTVTSLGDVDGDGVPDMAVGSPHDSWGGQYRGAVYVLLMNSNGSARQSVRIASGLNGGPALSDVDNFGFSVASPGDLDGDGLTDLAVGARLDDTSGANAGAIYVLLMNSDGTARSTTKIASGLNGGPAIAASDTFGNTMAAVGDLDGDGVGDLAVGAYTDSTTGFRRGAIYLLKLNSDGTVKTTTKIGDSLSGGPALSNGDDFGGSVASLGDLNGDGIIEIAVGSRGNDTGGTDRGAVYIMSLNGISNSAPLPIPAGPYAVGEGASIMLDGTLSYDIEDEFSALMLEWDFDYDGVSFQVDGTGGTPLFDASEIDGPATRTIALRVTDSLGASQVASTIVNIVNVVPTAVAGGPYVVTAGYNRTLDGSLSYDPGNDIADYEWDLNFDGINFDIDAIGVTTTFDAGMISVPTTRQVALRVRDTQGAESLSTAIVTVQEPPTVVIPITGRTPPWHGGTGNFDRVQIVVSLSEAASNAVEAEFQSYRAHLLGGHSSTPFTFTSLGLTLDGFESFDRVVEVGNFRGVYENRVIGTNYSEQLSGTTGADLILGNGGNDTIVGHGGNDIIIGSSGDDTLDGGDGDDSFLYFGLGNGFDTFVPGSGFDRAIATQSSTVIGVNGYVNGVDEFAGLGDTIIRDTVYSKTLDFSNTQLTGIAEVDANGGNDTLTASSLSAGVYRGGAGDDALIAGTAGVVWKFSGTANGSDTFTNGTGSTVAVAETAGTVIGVNGYVNGVDEFAGLGDTIIRDTVYSKTLDFSNTLLTGIAEVDANGGNDTLTASSLSAGVYRGGAGDDALIAGNAGVVWKFSGTANGNDTFTNGTGSTIAVAETSGTVIGVNGYVNGVDEFAGLGDTIIRDTVYSKTLDFSNTLLTGIAEVDANGGNDTLTASSLSAGVYRGGAGDDALIAGTAGVVWKFSGTVNGNDSFTNGTGSTIAVAETAGTIIGVNGYVNGVDEFAGLGDTVIRDTVYSKTLDFSNTLLTGIAEVDANGGNDTLTASSLSAGVYRGGAGDDALIAGNAGVVWKFSGTANGNDAFTNGTGSTIAVAETAGTIIGVNGYVNGVDEFAGLGDTIIRDTVYSKTLDFSNTLLTGIAEVDANGGNDIITVSTLSDGMFRLGAGDDILIVPLLFTYHEFSVRDFDVSGNDRIDLRQQGLTSGFSSLNRSQVGNVTTASANNFRLNLLDSLFADLTSDDFLFF